MKCKLTLVEHVDVTVNVTHAVIQGKISNITASNPLFSSMAVGEAVDVVSCAGEVVLRADHCD